MASTIFFNGRIIAKPGSYSEVDVSGLESVGLSASGIVAVLGEAIGGKPVSALEQVSDFIRITKPEQALKIFKEGDLREAIPMAFAPSNDPDILGGAQEVVAMKINPATAASLIMESAYGDLLNLVSRDYGAYTSQITVEVGDGTTKGILLTITLEDIEEIIDNLGGDGIFNLQYQVGGPTYWSGGITGEIENGGALVCKGIKSFLGALGSTTNNSPAGTPTTISVVSDNAGDVGQICTLYGANASNEYISEELTLNGLTEVIGSVSFAYLFGVRLTGNATLGAITIKNIGLVATYGTIAAGQTALGLEVEVPGLPNILPVDNSKVTITPDDPSIQKMLIVGKNGNTIVREVLTLNSTNPVDTVASFTEINSIWVGELDSSISALLNAEVIRTNPLIQKTIKKIYDYVEARLGFTFTILNGKSEFLVSNLDVTTGGLGPQSLYGPGIIYYADAYTIMDWINNNSQIIQASKVSGAIGGRPLNTTTPLHLLGGTEGTSTFSDWQNALNWLKQIRVNTIVVLTGDPSIHAALDAHCSYMGGIGKSERDGVVGLMNSGLTDVPSKDEAKTQIVNLNSRHIRAFAQAIERYDTAGERKEFPPYFQAVVAAGMQAGSPIGTSLTYKYANVLAVRNSNTWNPVDDAEELIQGGLCFMESIYGVGRRVVRNNTTYLISNNLAYTEASVNEAVNFATYSFRTEMEIAVGKRGFSGTINAASATARSILAELLGANAIVATRSLNLELLADVMEVSVEMAPVIPINFVKNTIHLITVPQTTV